jgi:hypothetical protein
VRHELTSGAWVEVRPIQDLKAKDKFAVSAAIKMLIPVTDDGELDTKAGLSLGGAMQTRSIAAVIARCVTAWSFTTEDGAPLPKPVYEYEQITHEDSIDELPLDDFNEIEELLNPYLRKLRQRPNPKGATTSTSSGRSPAKANGSRRG